MQAFRWQPTRWLLLGGVVLGWAALLMGSANPTQGQEAPEATVRSTKSESLPSRKTSPSSKNKKDEEQALAFVQQHLPELARLIRRLKQIDPKQYRRALAELNRQRRRLENWHRRNPKRYRLELAAWKAQQKAQLLAARLAMDPGNRQLQRQLREAIQQQVRARQQWLQMEKAQVEKRLQRIEKNLRYWSDPETAEHLYRSLLNSADKAKSQPAASPGAKNKKPKSPRK